MQANAELRSEAQVALGQAGEANWLLSLQLAEMEGIAVGWKSHAEVSERMVMEGLRQVERVDPLGWALGKYDWTIQGVEVPPPDFDVCLSASSHPLCLECQDLGRDEVSVYILPVHGL